MLIKIVANEPIGLGVTLTNIQSQSNEMVFVEGGLWAQKVVRRFALGLVMVGEVCPIVAEDGLLVIPDYVMISKTLVTNIKRARQWTDGTICPVCPKLIVSDRLDPNFRYFNKMTDKNDLVEVKERGLVYYEKGKKVYQIKNEYAYPIGWTDKTKSSG